METSLLTTMWYRSAISQPMATFQCLSTQIILFGLYLAQLQTKWSSEYWKRIPRCSAIIASIMWPLHLLMQQLSLAATTVLVCLTSQMVERKCPSLMLVRASQLSFLQQVQPFKEDSFLTLKNLSAWLVTSILAALICKRYIFTYL